ncbi:MAG: beta-galactosidase [Candidatus Geothermincolia bacterium]
MAAALIATTALLATSGCGAVAPEPADSRPFRERRIMGLFSHDWNNDFFRSAAQADQRYAAHASVIVSWDEVEPEQDRFTWDGLDATMDLLAAKGAKSYLMTLDKFLPAWAGSRLGPPRDIEDWRDFARRVAERYGDRVDYYQVWNEPSYDRQSQAFEKFNVVHFGGVFTRDYPPMLAAAYEEIKRADPDSYVICGTMNNDTTGIPENGTGLYDTMLKEPYRLQDHCDAIAVHPYYNPPDWARFYELLEGVLAANGVDKELVVTEIGWLHNIPDGFEVQRQAVGMTGIGSLVKMGVRKFWVYQDLDDPPGETFDYDYGLMDHQGEPHPAWDSFKAWVSIFGLLNRAQPDW